MLLLFWNGDGGGSPPSQTLAAGDLTTALCKWLETVQAAGDQTTQIRELLATQYGTTQPADLTTIFTRFLKERQ